MRVSETSVRERQEMVSHLSFVRNPWKYSLSRVPGSLVLFLQCSNNCNFQILKLWTCAPGLYLKNIVGSKTFIKDSNESFINHSFVSNLKKLSWIRTQPAFCKEFYNYYQSHFTNILPKLFCKTILQVL